MLRCRRCQECVAQEQVAHNHRRNALGPDRLARPRHNLLGQEDAASLHHASPDALLADGLLHFVGCDDAIASGEDGVARDAKLERNLASIEVGLFASLLVTNRVRVLERVLFVLDQEVAGVAVNKVVDELDRSLTLAHTLKPFSICTRLADKRVFADTRDGLDVGFLLLDVAECLLRRDAYYPSDSLLRHLGDLDVHAKASHSRQAKRGTNGTHSPTLEVEADLGQVGCHIRHVLHFGEGTTGSVDALFEVIDPAVDIHRSLTLDRFRVNLLTGPGVVANDLSLPRAPKLD